MSRFTYSTKVDHPPRTVFDWHGREGAFERLAPPWAPIRLEKHEGIREGDRAVIRLGWGPLSTRWVARHTACRPGEMFEDVQEEGPFDSWRHQHRFEAVGADACTVTDEIEYELPLGNVGDAVGGRCVTGRLREQFKYRHRVLANDLDLHRRYKSRELTVARTGSSGLIGSAVRAFLTTGGHHVLCLVRRPAASDDEVFWSPATGEIDAKRLEGIDAVVHLAGESIFAPRWSASKKRRIYDSRVQGTRLLASALAGLNEPPEVFVSSSAIGIYGDRGDEELTEESDVDDRLFLAQVCHDWEAATDPARDSGIRTVLARTGLVLSGKGGALEPMLPVFKAGLGGRLG
ncbi:MAG: NAD-dependent epimerase/dehydratase family protein, partial [Rhodothermales bacterium]|nr:NAD-dependent epimerase/dehydratase family protein [Rhodothermales bacterium]